MSLMKLGQVVTDLKLTSEDEVARAMRFAKDIGSPLGQALVAQEIISPTMLKGCIQAQWMLRDKLITLDECQAAIVLVQRRKWTFNDALVTLGFYCDDSKGVRLGELLTASGLLSPLLVDKALERAHLTCLPLGNVIVSFDFLEHDTVEKVLAIQKRLRLAEIELPSALTEIASLKVSAQALSKTSRILTRLLIDAELVTVDDVQSYHTAAVTTGRGLTDLLCLYSNLEPRQLFVVTSIARRIESGSLSYRSGMNLTTQYQEQCRISTSGQSFELVKGKVSLYVYMRLLDYLNADKVQELIGFLTANRAVVDRLVSENGPATSAVLTEAATSTKAKIRLCFDSDRLLSKCLLEAFPADQETIVKAQELLQLVNSSCLTLDESLFWSHG